MNTFTRLTTSLVLGFQETTFQVVLISDSKITFILMNYGDILHTTHTSVYTHLSIHTHLSMAYTHLSMAYTHLSMAYTHTHLSIHTPQHGIHTHTSVYTHTSTYTHLSMAYT